MTPRNASIAQAVAALLALSGMIFSGAACVVTWATGDWRETAQCWTLSAICYAAANALNSAVACGLDSHGGSP